jgi:2'-5' RNA ligase
MSRVSPSLLQLHSALVDALLEKQITFDNRNRFKPHVTLARHAIHPDAAALSPVIWEARHLVLVESRPGQGKNRASQYLPIAERMLGG